MKNNFDIVKFLIFFLLVCLNYNKLFAADLVVDAEVVDIKESGNLIVGKGAVSIVDGENISIKGNNAKYNRLNQIVEISGNVIFFDTEKNSQVKSNKIIFDRNNDLISSYGNTIVNILDKENKNVKFKVSGENAIIDRGTKILELTDSVILEDLINEYKIFSEKIIYNQLEEVFQSFNKTKINFQDKYQIEANDIFYDKNKNIIFSENKATILDNFENKFKLSNFNFDLDKKVFKANNIELIDKDNNTLELKNGYINLALDELVGSDFNLIFNKGLFGNEENDPRLFGRYIITNKTETSMNKSIFTTCKNEDGKCPAWSLSADEVKHVKEKKRIEYKNAWLEIYDVPVLYFPYFFHPDPTIKRQSGFLFPQFINSSNLGFSTQIPYFKAIDYDKDITISPRIYTNNNLFLQTEYRQAFENSDFTADFSINENDNTNTHLFSLLKGDFENSFYEMRIETVSNDNYLKRYQIKSPLIKNYSTLNSRFSVETISDDSSFSSSIDIIEDLSKKDSDKYEYIFPNFEYTKETYLNNNLFDTIGYKSSGNYHKFNTNVDEVDLVNDLVFSSNSNNFLKNSDTSYKFLLRNINTYGDLSNKYKDDKDYKLFTSFLYNIRYPLFKETNDGSQFLTPLLSFRYSPNKGFNLKNEKELIRFQDLFNLDRVSNKTIESRESVTLGLEYKNQNKFNRDRINLGLGVNLKTKEDEDLPVSTTLNKKTSDIIGYSGINITENLSIGYNFSIDENLSDTNYSLASLKYNSSIFSTSFEYMEKSQPIGEESYLNNVSKVIINNNNSLAFETNKNLDKNLTDYYNLIYKYKNDCLEASVIYNKQFYSDNAINSDKNIFFKISIIPFGDVGTVNNEKY
tara:strand:- start:2549 stop:5128 length:2580 start_codon:yes stop_codon:yes gene_type:complete